MNLNPVTKVFNGTVRELRERLKEYPDNAKVLGWNASYDGETDILELTMNYETQELTVMA